MPCSAPATDGTFRTAGPAGFQGWNEIEYRLVLSTPGRGQDSPPNRWDRLEEQVMASDLVVALGQAAVSAVTLFGANHFAPTAQRQQLRLVPGGNHPADEHL